jgi:tetratricopeptide (TPR) repeat protein
MAVLVDKFSKLHRLVSHHREADFQSCVAVVANQMFGSTTVYVDVRQGLTASDTVTIPNAYLIDLTSASAPRLFVVKMVIARNLPFWNTAVELFKFVASFDGAQNAIREFLHERIAHDTEALARLQQACNGTDVTAYLDTAVHGDFRGLVVIDDARDELNQVLSKINADLSVLELKTYEADDGSRLYQFDTLYGERALAMVEPAQVEEHIVIEEPTHTPSHVVLDEKQLRVTEEDDLEVAATLNSLAQGYRSQRKYAEAKELIKRALAMQERLLGSDHVDVASSLNRLALCYRALGKRAKAKPLFERALRLREKGLPPNDPRIATSLNNLALAYCAEGSYRLAVPLLERALAIKDKVFGPHHPRVATCLHNLAQLYRMLEKREQAQPLYTRALEIFEKNLGKNHVKVATVVENYALLLTEMQRHEEAAKLAARAQTIRTKQRRHG